MFNIDAILGSWYRGSGKGRFETANPLQQVFSPYDIPSSLIQDMISRGIRPFTINTIDLSVAGQQTIMSPGFHIVLYGFQTNSPIKAVNTQAYAEVFWGDTIPGGETGFPMKHARGISGPFQCMTLRWPAQANTSIDVITLAGMFHPWIDGESCT